MIRPPDDPGAPMRVPDLSHGRMIGAFLSGILVAIPATIFFMAVLSDKFYFACRYLPH